MKTVATAIAIAIAALTVTPAPAQAADNYWPAIYAPMVNADGGEVVVQVNAGPGTWQIKRSARLLDAQLSTVTIRTSGDCSTADLCVNVFAGDYDEAEMRAISQGQITATWVGLTLFPGAQERAIYLNNRGAPSAGEGAGKVKLHVAAHEFGHVLGLDHHRRPGLMSDLQRRRMDVLSAEEVAVLEAAYR